MKLLIAVFAVVTVLSAAGPQIPKGAVESERGTFHYTDAHGKKWIYRQTPFGIARFQEGANERPAPALDPNAGTKATADGDTIRFERPSPFGVYRWEKNKSELNEMERAVWERQSAKTAGN